MILEEGRHIKLWGSILTAGTILVGLLSAVVVINLPFSAQWLNSLLCASLCFFSIWFHQRHSAALQHGHKLSRALLVLGIAEMFLSVLFLRSLVQYTPASLWMSGFIFLSPIAYTFAYRLLFVAIFPRAQKSVEMPARNPLSEFPPPIQEIMEAGRKQVSYPVAYSMIAFTLLGSIMYLVSTFRSGEENPYLFVIPAALGYLVGFLVGILRTHTWQRWARRSGIAEQELKAAARAAHLWWPRIRQNTRLKKPRKFTG